MRQPPLLNKLIKRGAIFSIVAGIISSYIPWGDSKGFHGTGTPVPIVMWDKSPTSGELIDFPFVYAPLLNILIFVVLSTVLLTLLWLVWNWLSKRQSLKSSL